MKTLFFGTPELAVPYLEWVRLNTDLQAVVTTPDEPSGRGYALQATPVKKAALQNHLPVLQPPKLRDETFLANVRTFDAEWAVVVAYGKILPSVLLQIPAWGFMNVHFSLLPAYRGAAPIQRALMAGEQKTGVTLFWLDEGMDTGPIFLQKEIPIEDSDNAETLRQKLIPLGVQALQEVFQNLSKGEKIKTPQQGPALLAPPLKKEDGLIHWQQSARVIFNQIRGTNPWPGAYTYVGSSERALRIKILKALVVTSPDHPVGSIVGVESGQGIVIKCGQDALLLTEVQPEGKKPMSAWAFWQGARLKIGEKLG